MTPDLSGLWFSSYLGGGLTEIGYELVLDPSGSVTVGGTTFSSAFPTTPGALKTHAPTVNADAFVTRFLPDGSGLTYSTRLGGSHHEHQADDRSFSIALDDDGSVVGAGLTCSADFPVTPGAYDTTLADLGDLFVARLDVLPQGVARVGEATPGCAGASYVDVFSWPQVGDPDFTLRVVNGPPSASGLAVVGANALSAPVDAAGAALWIDPVAFVVAPVATDSVGTVLVPAAIPGGATAGLTAYAQFLFADPCAPAGVSATHALSVTIQP